MAQHKTIDRRKAGQKKSAPVPAQRNQTTAASVQAGREHKVIDRRQTGQKQTTSAPTAPARGQNTGGGGYYSPREYGAQTGAYEARVTAARAEMEQRSEAMRRAQQALEQLNAQVQEKRSRYQELTGTFEGDTAAEYEQRILDDWTQAVDLYDEGRRKWEQEYAAYKPYEDAYNAALGEYNAYVSAERAEYDRWRGSIRDSESVRKERSELQGKRSELQRLMQQQNAIASGTAAPGIQAQAAQNEARIKELQEYLGGVGEREKLLAEELDWSEHFRFEDLRQNVDFAEKSRFTGVDNQGDRVYQYVNGNPNAVSGSIDALLDRGTQDDLLMQMMGGNDGWRDIIGYNETPTYLEHMTDEEKAMYNYVYSTQGREAAQGYLDHLKPELTARKTGEATKFWRMLAGQNALTGALFSGLSVPMNAAGGIQAGVGQVASAIRGEELDPNASYNLMANTKNAIRDEVSGKIQEHAGPVGSFAYGTVMSMADMAMDAATGNPAAATALIGTRAFSEQVIDAKNRGLSDEQALSMGITSAFAELVTEKLGLDELLHLPDKWATAGFWKGAARGAGGEALEEGLTNLMNLAADISIAGDKSEFAQSVERYKAEGLSEEKAVWKALGDAGWSLAADMAGGAISGGVYGGIDGWRGKKASTAQKETSEKADDGQEPDAHLPGPEDYPDGVDAYGNKYPGGYDAWLKDAKDEGLVEDDAATAKESSAVETVSAQAVQENVQKRPEADRKKAQTGKTLDELRQIALNHRNPLLTGSLNTARQEEELRRIRNAQTRTEVTGIDYGATDEQVQEALRIGKLIGKEVLFAPKGQSYNAFYDRASDEIHVAPDAENLLAAAVGHELTHSIERTGEWERLRGLVATRMAQTGVSMESARRDRMEKHAAAGLALTDERTVDQEIVANFVEKHLLTDEQSIRALVRDERSIARRILDWLDGLWARVAKTGKSQEREFVRKAREIYRSALAEDAGKRRRQDLRRAAQDAYADGDDAAGDAALDAALGENPEGWLETDWEDYDENEIEHSVREQEDEGSFTRGWHDDDEAARAAQMEGYPVINGVQVVPMKTFVLAQDFRKDKAGNLILDKQGNPIQNHNYGLVAGLGSKPGTLKINFHNKHKVNEETGQTLRKDGVEIDIADLTPTPGVFQQTDEDFQSLIEQAPEEETYYSEEDWAEIEALRNRASTEEAGGGRPEHWESVTREDITGRARESLQRGERQLAGRIAGLMMVPRWARQDFLEPVVRGLIDTYLEQGTVDQGLRDELFDTAWKEGRVVEREFYDTYRDVKDYLRTTPMYVPQEIRDSIGDFDEYSRRIFGKIRAKKEKFAELMPGKGEAQQAILGFFPDGTRPNPGKNGGLDIDTVWSEAQQMAPELFPEDILNQEDRVRHMLDVAASIKKTEMNLNEFYAGDLEDAKQWSRNNFEVAVQDAIRTAWEVRRVALDQQADAAAVAGEDGEVLTVEEVAALYPKLKDVRRELEKAMAKNLLNKQDKNQVQRLLRHDIQPEHLDPKVDNVRGILAVYEAKKAFEEIAEPIRRWNKQRKARLYAEAEELVYEAEMAGGIKDKGKGFLYSRETMERNIRDIVKNPEHADKIIDTYFRPVHQAEAAATRMKNQYRERVKALDISRKVRQGDQVSEAYAVQFYGEVSDILRMMEQSKFRLKQRDGKSYKEWKAELQKLWEDNPSLDKAKIENAAKEMGKIYEELFTQMNQARVENGYEPINHRSGYFPHFQQDGRDGILAQFGKALGIDVEVQALPTSINGMTHTFKPGIRWFGHALERKTFDTAYDAVEGFDRYIEGCASVVHQTANIQRLRALANQIRYRTGDEGLREQIRKIQAREDLTDEQKDTLIRETASEGKFQLSNFVVELDEYTNLLANKKSRADRNMEQAMGRDMYNIVKALESRVAANMVAINPGSWLTNFIPITQGWAALDTRYWLKGMGQTIRAVRTDDGMVDMSDFLTNRVGSDALVQTTAQKVAGVLSSPMEWIDGFTAGSLVRARYAQNIAQGMSEAEAMSEADEWTAGVMADRSKGAMPTVFHRSNPLTKVFTQFQLEVNNQLGYMFKDIPREKRKKGVLAVAAALLKLALGAWLYNELYEKLLGRRPALDPIDMAFGFVTDWADPELDFADAAANLGGKIAENTPFIGGLVGGGRVPISSALPDVQNLVKAVGDSDWSAGKKLAAAGKELAKPLTYMVLPFGGGQVKKIWEGLQMIRKDGSYTVDKDGRPLLQYPLYSTNDAVQKALEAGQAMLFGKTTIRSGRAWVEGGFKNLSADQTATYQALVNLGVEQVDAFKLMQELRGAEKTGEQSRAQVQRDILRASGLEGDALGIVYYDLLVDDDSKEKALMEALQKDGADMGAVASCLMDMKDAADSNAKRDILRASGLTDEQKQDIYRDRISESYDERIGKFREAGMDMDDFLIAQNEYTRIKDSYEDEGDMATAFARWVNNSGYTAAQKTVIRDSLKYWKQMPANADGYDRAIEAGLSDKDAAELVEAIGELEPPEGKTSVQEIQKYRVAIDQSVNESNQLRMLQSVGLKDSSYDKVAKGYEMGVAPAAWVRVKEVQQQFDANGNGSMTNAEWEAAIEGICSYGIVLPGDNTRFNMTNEQKGVLWQMMVGKNTKSKNNPFDPAAGQRWRELMGYE